MIYLLCDIFTLLVWYIVLLTLVLAYFVLKKPFCREMQLNTRVGRAIGHGATPSFVDQIPSSPLPSVDLLWLQF